MRVSEMTFEKTPPPHMIVKSFEWTTIHNKALYKCLIHSWFDIDVGMTGEFYSVEQINYFLDETKGKSVQIEEVFPDLDKFDVSVMKVRKECSVEVVTAKKV